MQNNVFANEPGTGDPDTNIPRRNFDSWLVSKYVVGQGTTRVTYSDPENIDHVMFEELGDRFTAYTHNNDIPTAAALIAKGRGWKHAWVEGTDDFKKDVWMSLSRMGIKVNGHSPSPGEKRDLVKVNLVDKESRATVQKLRKNFRAQLLRKPNMTDEKVTRALARFDKRADDELAQAFHSKKAISHASPNQIYSRSPVVSTQRTPSFSR